MSATTKSQLRTQLLAARRAVPDIVRQAEATALKTHVLALVELADTICAFVPMRSEPGSTELLDALAEAGVRVLLPITRPARDGAPTPLAWGVYTPGDLVPAAFGILEPAGDTLPPATVAQAGVVLVPALAVDRRGVRLGRGAGYYDRSLPLRNPVARLIAVVRDTELVDELPAEPHDVPMTDALTPGLGLVRLGATGE
ncbi:5-formyltetrahydrofolate cyclo-ligase [Mycolicibacterium mengxianglii]|uniref:5-formyltetrahydrofolate cyclo-ligase n=1 Tax=Mycolicibacterium mengxianglii TaxID=2736649 RepID=UPI0018EEE3E8|nr:5-formyltetrahydrofolate cyclo-ligase [Mycolicibacterium mengxianglii]